MGLRTALSAHIENQAQRGERAEHERHLGRRLTPFDRTQPRAGTPDSSRERLLAEVQLPPTRADECTEGSWRADFHDDLAVNGRLHAGSGNDRIQAISCKRSLP